MAIVRAIVSGLWSAPGTWSTGSLPTTADDVYSNGFTVTIDISPTVLSISNATATGVTAGGSFVPNNGITMQCTAAGNNCIAGTVTSSVVFDCTLASGQSCALTANCIAGSTSTIAARHSGAGTLNITGRCTGGTSSNAMSAVNAGIGTLNINGDCTGGTAASCFGANNASTGILTITGTVTGSSINGNSPGANNASTGILTITGTVTASVASGAINFSTGTLNHSGIVQASATSAGITGTNAGQNTILTGPFLTSNEGINPVYCTRWFWLNASAPVTRYEIRSANRVFIRPLYSADNVGGNPAVSDVRSGTVYGPAAELIGTCAIPPAASVAFGVPTGATTGTAAITADSIRSALGLATANLDTQLAAVPANVWSAATRTLTSGGGSGGATAAEVATAVWTAATRTLTSGGGGGGATAAEVATAVWGATVRAITGGTVDTASNAPTAAAIAGQVRTELATELARVDTAISTRLAAISYSAAPTTTAIRTELSAELARLDVAVSTRLAPSGTLATVTTLTNVPNVPSATTIASQVRTELATELARIDVATGTRLATTGYTTPPTTAAIATAVWANATRSLTTTIATASDVAAAVWGATVRAVTGGTVDTASNVPTATTIASQVRTELATELARIDAATSSRLASASYTAPTTPPTAAAIRAEMDANSTKLASLDAQMPNKASVDQVASIVQGATSA